MITTKRLFLIPWHASDADELYELAKDPEIGPLCGWEPHKTLEDSKQVLANVLSDKSCYAVKDMKTGHVIGSMSLNFEEISDLKDPSKQLHQELAIGLVVLIGDKGWHLRVFKLLPHMHLKSMALTR